MLADISPHQALYAMMDVAKTFDRRENTMDSSPVGSPAMGMVEGPCSAIGSVGLARYVTMIPRTFQKPPSI